MLLVTIRAPEGCSIWQGRVIGSERETDPWRVVLDGFRDTRTNDPILTYLGIPEPVE